MSLLLVICFLFFFRGVYDYIPLNHEYLGKIFPILPKPNFFGHFARGFPYNHHHLGWPTGSLVAIICPDYSRQNIENTGWFCLLIFSSWNTQNTKHKQTFIVWKWMFWSCLCRQSSIASSLKIWNPGLAFSKIQSHPSIDWNIGGFFRR